jgi:hypothetical protein
VTVADLLPFSNVGVCATTAPEEEATVTLCAIGAEFLKAIVTAPALALNDVVVNFSWPSGFASTLTVAPAPVAEAGVLAVGVLVGGVEVDGVAAAGVLAGALVAELVLLEELPQPASASTSSASVGTATPGESRDLRMAFAVGLTVCPPI